METEELLSERGSSHGDYVKQGGLAAQLKNTVRMCSGWDNLPWFAQDAIDMILVKISRAVCGQWCFADHWDDIIGYASLVAKEIKKGFLK